MKERDSQKMPFYRINYIFIIAGIVSIALGYICMVLDKEPYGFGVFGITIGPILGFLNFLLVCMVKAGRSNFQTIK